MKSEDAKVAESVMSGIILTYHFLKQSFRGAAGELSDVESANHSTGHGAVNISGYMGYF